jgi:hypothetical protein
MELINPDTCFIRNLFSRRVVNDEGEVFTTSSTITVSNFVYIHVLFPILPDQNLYNPDYICPSTWSGNIVQNQGVNII